jgi:hypothetical protein
MRRLKPILSRIGRLTPSHLELERVEASATHRVAKVERVEGLLSGLHSGDGYWLMVMGRYIKVRSVLDLFTSDVVKKHLPKKTLRYLIDYEVEKPVGYDPYRTGLPVVTVIKKYYDSSSLNPVRCGIIRAYEYVKHRCRGGETTYSLAMYGRAFHRAVEMLASSRDVETALREFRESLQKLCGPIPFNEMSANVAKPLKALMEMELYREYGTRYVKPRPRIIIIDDEAAVLAQPDFKSVDNAIIYDVKAFNVEKMSRDESERVEKQVRVYQLAYPGSRAIVLGLPYGCEEVTIREFEPITFQEAKTYLQDLKNVCREVGSIGRLNVDKYESVRYIMGEGEISVEVFEEASDESGRPSS